MERVLQGRYRVLRSLGSGGRGAVYLCDDLRLEGKQWALKRMHPTDEADFRERFQREAVLLSTLRHPNLPLVVDHFEEGGDSYLVMEHVDGVNLAEHVRANGPLSEAAAFERGLVLAGLLHYLHTHEPPIIFRDLKPDNVMLGSDGVLKLVDFGLARRFSPGKASDTIPSGSVGYAAPEQWEDLAQTDERSDIYAWGATLLYLVTGRNPNPHHPLGGLKTAKHGLSQRGRDILARCMQPRPADRFPTVQALMLEVRRHLATLHGSTLDEEAHSPSALRVASPSPVRRAAPMRPRPRRRHIVLRALQGLRGPLALLLAATLAFLGLVVAQVAPRPTPPPTPPRASPTADEGVMAFYLPSGATAEKEEGRRLYAAGRWAEAIARLDEATVRAPQDAEAHILKENAYILLNHEPFVRVPFIASGGGPDAPDFFPHLYGLALAQADINARGGVNGKKLVLDIHDDGSSTTKCLQIAEQLTRDPSVLVVMGPTNSQRTLACAPLFNAARVNLVVPTASSQRVFESGPYVFPAADSREPLVRGLARHVLSAGHRRVAVLRDETSRLSMEMVRLFSEEVRAGGGTVLELPPFQDKTDSFAAQIDAIEQASPDIVFFGDYRAAPMVLFAKQLRERGLQTPLCSQTIAFARELTETGGDAVEGLLLTTHFHPHIDTPRMKSLMAEFRRRFGDVTPTFPVTSTYDALQAVAQGLAASSDRASLHQWLLTAGPFEGVGGRFALGRHVNERTVWLMQVSQGRFRLVQSLGAPGAAKPR